MGYGAGMANQSMLHIAAVVGGSVFIRAFVSSWWDAHKAKVEARGIPLRRNRRGVYVSRSYVQLVESAMHWFLLLFILPLFLLGLATRIFMGPS